MKIILQDLGKRYNRNWIFRDLNFEIQDKDCIAVTGPNGSGKSTLLKIISTFNEATKGKISYLHNNTEINEDEIATKIGYAAPYLNLIEEFTLAEHLNFHSNFKKALISFEEMAHRSLLENAMNKSISVFSSGMKSRLKLVLALFFENELIFLDEPTANMDEQGIEWYRNEVKKMLGKKNIIIASNSRYEFDFTNNQIDLRNYKKN